MPARCSSATRPTWAPAGTSRAMPPRPMTRASRFWWMRRGPRTWVSTPDLPPHALAAGADAMVTCAHRALPAYTQGALVLARTGRLDAARLDRAFEATHTTSPAGAIMASTDAARALLARDGTELCG